MKKYSTFIIAIIFLFIILFVSCVKTLEEEGIYSTTDYIGTVVEKSTMQPIKGVKVQVTDGTHVHASTITNELGAFELKGINFEEVNKSYYLWLDGTSLDLPCAQEQLKGLGRKTFDYKTLILYDKTNASLLPKVTTEEVSDIAALTAKVAGNVTANGGHEVTQRGFCFAQHQTPTLDDSVRICGAGNGKYTYTLSELSKSTTYFLRAFATNSIGTVYGAQKTFTTKSGKATITTTAANNVNYNSAVVGGNITDDGGDAITVRGICWGTSENPTLSNSHSTDGNGIGSFTHTLQGLQTSTIYYYRAYATNSCGTTYGTQKNFTTKSGLPELTTTSPTNIAATSAKSGGNITSNGGFNVTTRGVCWNTLGNPDTNDSHSSSGSGNGAFTVNMTNLRVGTTYHVRAYAVNQKGITYGNEHTFTTTNGLPIVTTSNTTSITATTAVCNGSVTDDGGFAITAKGFCWSTSQYPTTNEQHNNLGTGTGALTSSITGLTRNTTYYVRAYATNANGTVYGTQKQFTTSSGLPSVTTTAVTMSSGQVVSGGNVTSDGGFPVTDRGICYGAYPNPDLSNAYTHTTNGTGTGYFTSLIDTSTSGTIYVRAYATNANGTVYGNQIIVNLDYLRLPTFTYNGHTYIVAPDPGVLYNWSSADAYCSGLTLYGYSDWRMPTQAELVMMCSLKDIIGGFSLVDGYARTRYWSSTTNINNNHYSIMFDFCEGGFYSCYLECTGHVRPIRVEN